MAKHCVSCGTKLPDKSAFCWKCGKPQGNAQAAPSIVTTTTTTTTTTTGPLPKSPPQQGQNVVPPPPPGPARQAEPYVAFIIVTMILVLTVLALMLFGYALPHIR